MIDAFRAEYPLEGDTNALCVTFKPGAPVGTVEVNLREGRAEVYYDCAARACRGLGALLSGCVKPGETYRERTSFTTLGIMLDCSRNAVMTVAHVKRWLRRLALLGYNMAMLYTEDTYELRGEESSAICVVATRWKN